MYTRGPRSRITAVAAMVVLALTGFSSGCGHESRSDSRSAGGSSGSDAHDSGTSTGSSGGATHLAQPTHRSTPTASLSSEPARPLKDGTAVLISCASTDDPYAIVDIRNPNARDAVFTVKISFKDEHGFTMIDTRDQVSVPAKDTTTYRRAMASAGRPLDEIARCEVDPRATADR